MKQLNFENEVLKNTINSKNDHFDAAEIKLKHSEIIRLITTC